MSGWGQNQGWGGQQQQQPNQGWGGQQQQGAWGTQQGTNQGTTWGTQQGTQPANQWGTQQTNQATWGTQQSNQQGTWGTQQGTQQTNQWGTQQTNQWGAQQNNQGTQGTWGTQQSQQQKGGIMGGITNLFNKFTHHQKPNKLTRPYYSFASQKADGKVFDICGNGQKQGSLIIWQGYGGPNQSFGILQEGNKYLFKCKQPHGYLTVQGPQDGASFFISPTKTNASYFDFEPVGNKKYLITTCYGKAMDIQNQDKSNGTSVIQWPVKQKDRDNQIWMLMDPKEITSSSDERY